MSALSLVRRIQRRLAALLAVRTAVWTAIAATGALAIHGLIAALYPLPGHVAELAPWLAATVAVLTCVVLVWKARFVGSVPNVALWIEERAPELRYALVSAVDPRFTDDVEPWLGARIAGLEPERLVRLAARRALLPPGALLLALVALLGVMPGPASSSGPGAVGTHAAAPPFNRLAKLRAEVTPPEYARAVGAEGESLRDPVTITALAGSEVTVSGVGSAQGLEAWLDETALDIADDDGAWTVRFTLSESPGLLRLVDREHQRLVVLAPVRDDAPRVQLLRPARDTTLHAAEGELVLSARARDDLGLRTGWFEYIVSSGEGEGNYTFREGTLGRTDMRLSRDGMLRLTVALEQFELRAGDRLSIRAVAHDNNTLTGPGTGYSETRVLRLAHPSEFDSLAVTGAPPAVDSTLMTLRYLILLTEELEEGRSALERAVFVDSSSALGRRAERLRDRVGSLQADQTLGGLFEGNPLLDTAYLELTRGASTLHIAEPGEAALYLNEALRVLLEYARAERYYTRGGTPDVIVDLERVRLSGTETGRAAPRTQRDPPDTHRARFRMLYAEAMARMESDREGALQRWLELQAEALRTDPTLATVLGTAIAELREGKDAEALLRRVRNLIEGEPMTLDTLPHWSRTW